MRLVRQHGVFLAGWVILLAAGRPAPGQISTQNFNTWPTSNAWVSSTNDGWALSQGWVSDYRGPLGSYIYSVRSAFLQDYDVGTNAWLRTPWLPNGIGTLSFLLRNTVEPGMNAFDIQTSADGTNWTTRQTLGHDHAAWMAFEETLNIRSPVYVRIFKVGDDDQGTNQYLGLDDVVIATPADVELTDLRHIPTAPTVQESVHIEVNAATYPAASNLVLTAFYRRGFAGGFTAIGMTPATGQTYRTATPIPGGYEGQVQYYVRCDYAGLGPSPVYAPPEGSNGPALFDTSNPYAAFPSRQLGPCTQRTPLIVSEIMYHPPPRADGKNLEFVEIFNTEAMPHDLSGYRLSGDIAYRFPSNTVLASRTFLVVARDPDAFQAVYGKTALGPFTNNLPNSRGTVRLRHRTDAILLDIAYDTRPPWPVAADGGGHSLVLSAPDYGEQAAQAWSASAWRGGSPLDADPIPNSALRHVRINEFRAHTDPPDDDFIELYNHGLSAVDLSGCWLSDEAETPKFRIPDGVTLDPRDFLSFSTNTHALGFELSARGEDIFLFSSNLAFVVDAVRFEAQENGVAVGRFPDGGAGFFELAAPTPGLTNAPLRHRGIVINELMYHPISDESADEYVELHNLGAQPVDLSYWRFVDGIDFMFPPGTTIPAGGYLVVAKDAARLIARYPQLDSGNTVGDYGGSLSDRGERVALAKPDNPQLPYEDFVVVDEVTYNDGWGRWTDGEGSSLELRDPRADRRLAANWAGSDESAKAVWTTVEHTGPLDLGHSGYPPDEVQILLRDAGECLIDNLQILKHGTNVVYQANFESGVGGWWFIGNHRRSQWRATEGDASAASLHLVATGDGDTGANHLETDISGLLTTDSNVTIRARCRWLAGCPYIVVRLLGNWLEAAGTLRLPPNLGTPGLRNSAYATNAGPAIADAVHTPILPGAGSNVVVTARLHDPDGVAAATLNYRLDPATGLTAVAMNDAGLQGDAVAGDGVFSATLPGQAANTLVAFHITALDGLGAGAAYPPAAPAREALILFGQTQPAGNFGAYRIWITQAVRNLWASLPALSNDPMDVTLVYNDQRAIYEAGARYRGSPFLRRGGDPVTITSTMALLAPAHDRLLGATGFNLDDLVPGRDNTSQRERMSFWLAERLDIPSTYQRYIHFFANQNRKGVVFADNHYPNRSYLESWFPGRDTGELFEVDDWFEFNDGFGFASVNATLQDFTTAGGVKKTARYRWSWEKKGGSVYGDDYTSIFRLVDAMNLSTVALRERRVADLVDYEEWMRAFGVRHIVGDWDGYSYSRGKNSYVYKPVNDRWAVLPWDLDFSLGGGSRGETDSLFAIGDPVLANNFFGRPVFRRAYWRAMQDAINGPLRPEVCGPVMDANYNGLQKNGIAVTEPSAIKTWISNRVAYIASQLAPVTNLAFAVTTADFVTSSNPATIAGRAPVQVQTLLVNSNVCETTWTSETDWTIAVPLQPGTNVLDVTAWTRAGEPAGNGRVTVTYTGAGEPPTTELAINEIMYHSAAPLGDFVEILNLSSHRAFDLSGYRLDGVDFVFPFGTFIKPGQHLVVAESLDGYARAYQNSEVVAGVYSGSLDNGGETLRLLRPVGSNEWVLLDQVRYDDDPPWPPQADGQGASLQLIDPWQDNDRVANWAAADPTAPAPWVFKTGTLTTINDNERSLPQARFHFYLTGPGRLHIDNVSLVRGDVPEQGTNALRNGNFETAFSGPWTAALSHASSAISSAAAYAGSNSLLIEATGPGEPTNLASVSQSNLGLINTTRYTVSYWYLPTTEAYELAVELRRGPILYSRFTHSVTLPPSGQVLCTPGTTNLFGAALPPFPGLWINEIMPANAGFIQDNHGDYDPWLELYNAETGAIDLTSFRLSIAYPDLNGWAFPPGTQIGPGQRLLIWADAQPWQTVSNALHAGFRLNSAGGLVTLARQDADAVRIIDHLTYGAVGADLSYGSYPEGESRSRQIFHYPTPGSSNSPVSTLPPIRINEWMADNKRTLADPADGDFEDWFELFNAGDAPVDLGGFVLKNTLQSTNRFVIPAGRSLAPRAFLLVWADSETGQNASNRELHVNFKLSAGGEEICLLAPDGRLVDHVVFGAQLADVSEGLWPDGAADRYPMNFPSPRGPNTIFELQGDFLGDPVRLTWPSAAGRRYRVDYTEHLTSAVWNVFATVTAVGNPTSIDDPSAHSATQRFYRVSELK